MLKLSTSASTLRTWESQVEILKLSTSARLVLWGLEMLDQVCCRVLQVCPAPDTGLLVRWHHLHKGAYGTTDHGAGCPLQIKSNVRLTRDTTLRLTLPWLKCKSPTEMIMTSPCPTSQTCCLFVQAANWADCDLLLSGHPHKNTLPHLILGLEYFRWWLSLSLVRLIYPHFFILISHHFQFLQSHSILESIYYTEIICSPKLKNIEPNSINNADDILAVKRMMSLSVTVM